MRLFLFLCFIFFASVAGAQSSTQDYLTSSRQENIRNNSHSAFSALGEKKWFVSRYSGLVTGLSFFNGGIASYTGVPLGLQLSRRLNNNLYAFAGVSVMPAYVNFSNSFRSLTDAKIISSDGLYRSGTWGVNSRAELGLMYISSDRGFSISGSIGVQRGGYPVYLLQPGASEGNTVILSKSR